MIRLGMIGFGTQGRKTYGKAFWEGQIEGAELVAICDTNPAQLAWVNENHPEIKTFDNADALYKSGEIDAVLIVTPHYDHPALAMQAMDAKIHVLIDKPAGVFTKDVREMNAKAAESDVVFAIMYNQRTNPIFRKMHDMIHGGELGALKRFSWIVTDWYRSQAYYNSGGWRATWKGEGGGVLINQCPHNLDLWQWILGMPKRITAFTHEGKWHDIEVEDDVTAYVEYENGATGVFITSTADCPGTNRFEVLGDLGKLVFENDKLIYTKLEMSEREFSKTNTEMFGRPNKETTEIDCTGDYPQHVGIINNFVKAIHGEESLIAKGEEGINGLTISNAIHLSGWLNTPIELPLDEDLFLAELKKRWK